jgi:hypothetical protein
MNDNITRVKYTGTAPGANNNVYELFSTTTAELPEAFFSLAGIFRVSIDIMANANGSLIAYKSDDRGANWYTHKTDAVTGSTSATTTKDYLVEGLRDFKLVWSNTSSSAQTTWKVDIALVPDRHPLS